MNSIASQASGISPEIQKLAPIILAEIQKAKSILLHCHPSPDPDSVGSTLAMKYALEGMGKQVTAIGGDSEMPHGFRSFPGVASIQRANFFDLDLSAFDLFIIQDSGSPEMISRFKPVAFPLPVRSIVIDHHASNTKYGDINLVEPAYPAAAQVLHDLFMLWGVKLTREIATNLFMGIYSDTGGFRYAGTSKRTFEIVGELVTIAPDFLAVMSDMDNSNTPGFIAFEALALNSVRTFLGGAMAFSVIPNAAIAEKQLALSDIRGDAIAPVLRSVEQWKVSGLIIELQPGMVKMNFRSKSLDYDVSKLAVALGGGGHKMAAGANMKGTIDQAVEAVVAKAKELYTL